MANTYSKDGVLVTRMLGAGRTPLIEITDSERRQIVLTFQQFQTLKTFDVHSGPAALEASGWEE